MDDLYYYYMLFGYVAFIVVLSLYVLLRNRNKILIKIKGYPEKWVHKKPQVDEKGFFVIMRDASKKQMRWQLHFTNKHLLKGSKRFGTFDYIETYPESPEAICSNWEDKTVTAPRWDKETSKQHIEAEILKKAGKEPEQKTNSVIILLAILIIVNIAITVILSGRVHIG